jgi:DNA-directed RNA polymerase subunit E'
MYLLLTLKDRIRVPPELFGRDLKEAVREAIKREYEGHLSKKHGLLLALVEVEEIGEGTIVPGDGAIYYDTQFKMLAYKPVMQEVVEGKISQITEFGAFVRIGPIDGLVHISQVMDDYVSYSKSGSLQGRESKRVLKTGDRVRARIIAISLKSAGAAKIGLTMRQPGLGKLEWIQAEKGGKVG